MRHPRRRVVVGGVDITERYGLDLLDGFTLSPPAPKTYTVDIPGGDGCVDVTEAIMGDVSFEDRQMSFTFLVVRPESFEATKTAVAGFLHGRRFDFELSWDPGYTYTGRFSVSEWYAEMHHGQIKVDVDAEPYKLREHRRVRVAAGGGRAVTLACGRKRQCPTFECASECLVSCNGATARLQPGTWRAPALWLEQGANTLWCDSDLSGGDRTAGDVVGAGTVGDALAYGERVGDLMWTAKPEDSEELGVYVSYDIKEL